MKIAKDGIFPITKDQHGHPLPISPASGLDIPGTIQGEGKLCGVPSLFIRLAGCNLHCCWTLPNNVQVPCDTSYAAYELQNVQTKSVNDICSLVLQNTDSIRHLVITGGEPLLQAQELEQLCEKLKKNVNTTLPWKPTAPCLMKRLPGTLIYSVCRRNYPPPIPPVPANRSFRHHHSEFYPVCLLLRERFSIEICLFLQERCRRNPAVALPTPRMETGRCFADAFRCNPRINTNKYTRGADTLYPERMEIL